MVLQLATLDDLQAACPGVSDEVGRSALDRASALVRAIARQDFDYVEHDTVTLAGGGRELLLPQRPVVVDDDHPLTVTGLTGLGADVGEMLAGQHFTRSGGILSRPPMPAFAHSWTPAVDGFEAWAGWVPGAWPALVRVTYTHGYEVAPAWLTAITVNAASVYATNPEGLFGLRVGGIEQTFMRSTVQRVSEITDQIKAELRAVGMLPSRAFSIVPS